VRAGPRKQPPGPGRRGDLFDQRLESGGKPGRRRGRIGGQQRHRGTVGVIEMVEPAGDQLKRASARRDPNTDDPAAWNRGGGQRPWSPAGHAERREPGDAQPVGNSMRIGGDRREPERRGSGTAVSGPVEGHKPDAPLGRDVLTEAEVKPGAGGPVEIQHRWAVRLAHLTGPQYPAAAVYLNLAHPLTINRDGARQRDRLAQRRRAGRSPASPKMGQLPDAPSRNGHVLLGPSAGNAVPRNGAIGLEAT
jgi:hypothetical protein